MKIVENQVFDQERALYGEKNLIVRSCKFEGPADGESALKECFDIKVEDSYWALRYPFWHDHVLSINNTELTELCRAAIWYSDHVMINNSKLHGIKALRECKNCVISNSDIISPEFGWSVDNLELRNVNAEGEYFLMRSNNVRINNLNLKGKYSFQYINNMRIEDSVLDTKDAFWHTENVTVVNSTIKGEYLAWYSKGLTLINCTIIGTQPLCYCKDLTMIDCEMVDTDLAFEKSEVNATILNTVDSIKNPLSGVIRVQNVNKIIMDDKNAKGEIVIEK